MTEAAPLPWHAELWSSLQDARGRDRMAHALLLAGPAGTGKRRFARAWTASLLCESPAAATGFACGHCRSCVQLAAQSHPNLQWISPAVDDKTGKEKRDISVDQLRGLMERLMVSSHYGQFKLAVIDPADAMNLGGINALLKTVEEPPPRSQILLISERPMALPATLRSRCQRLRFSCPTDAQARAWLDEIHPQVAAQPGALEAAFGAPLRAVDRHRSGLAERASRWRQQLLAVSQQRLDPLAAAGEVGKDREDAAQWIAGLIVMLRDLLKTKLLPASDAQLAPLARGIPATGLEQLLQEAFETLRRLQTNAQPQLAVESLMIAWWRWTRSSH